MVKEGIRKLKFSQHLKRAEGAKTPKVELTISIDGVAIQDPKTKRISHQYPLHRISYCADDKTDPKFFSFIAKEADCDKHNCFVFVSDKLAEEITLTIGQAFDLAYRRFLETSGRDLEMRKQLMVLQKRVQELEAENVQLKSRLSNYENKQKSTNKIKNSSNLNGTACNKIPSIQPPPPSSNTQGRHLSRTSTQPVDLLVMETNETENGPLDDENFNPREFDSVEQNGSSNGHSESPSLQNGNNMTEEKDVFGCEPFNPGASIKERTSDDPFGMGSFEARELEQAIGAIDKKLAEMRVSVIPPLTSGQVY